MNEHPPAQAEPKASRSKRRSKARSKSIAQTLMETTPQAPMKKRVKRPSNAVTGTSVTGTSGAEIADAEIADAVSAKTHVIVTGVARSGTTALARLLNAHEDICLGVERFKFQFLRAQNHSAALFEHDRFFTFLDEDTNIHPDNKPEWQPLYADIARKWDRARVIGDKVPDMMPVLPAFMQANPDFKCIYILRGLRGVASSWQARANDRRDSWPSGRGFELACQSWAEQSQALERLMASGQVRGRMLLLDYDNMYEPGNRSARAILRFLNLKPSAAFSATYQEHVDFFQSRRPARARLAQHFKDVYAKTDKTDFRALRNRARRHIIRLAGKQAGVPTA